MPRRNRPRKAQGSRGAAHADAGAEVDEGAVRAGWRRVEMRHGIAWNVQPMTADRAVKPYSCPGCGRMIEPNTAHLVVWRSDGVTGDAADLASRRHWHSACWRAS